MKQVDALGDQHVRDLWRDAAGYVWFYENDKQQWTYLWPSASFGSTGWRKVSGYLQDFERQDYGPYTRVAKGLR